MREPVEGFRAAPRPSNIHEWRFVLFPPEDSPYAGGQYQGKLVLPKNYPFSPPRVMMLTPSGRFVTGRRLCMSFSDFHPETWVATQTCAKVILGLLSFMLDSDITYGSIETSVDVKRAYAASSKAYNAQDPVFSEMFPDLVDGIDTAAAGKNVELDAALDPASALGHEAKLTGLSSEQWNGKQGYVTSYDQEAARYTVHLDGASIKVKVQNLVVLKDPTVAGATAAAAGGKGGNGATSATKKAGAGGRDPADSSTWGRVKPNEPCPCESGKKHKKCCMNKQ